MFTLYSGIIYVSFHLASVYICRFAFSISEYIEQDPEYCNGLPILERIVPSRKRLYSVEDIVKLLLHPDLRYITTKVPTSISESVSFLIDLDKLDNKDDVLSDDMGVWKNNGVDTTFVHVTFSGSKVKTVVKCGPPGSYSVKRVYRIHDTDRSLKKLTTYIYNECREVHAGANFLAV